MEQKYEPESTLDKNTESSDFSDSTPISSDNIEVVSGEIVDNEDRYPDDTLFKTGQVAAFLGMDPQMIRNSLNLGLSQFVDIKNTGDKGSVRKWTKQNIKDYRALLELKKKTGMTFEQLIEYKNHPESALVAAKTDDKAFERLMVAVRKNINESINAITAEQSKHMESLIDEKFQNNFSQLNSTLERSLAHQEEITLLKKEEEIKAQEKTEKSYELLLQQLALVTEKLGALEDENKRVNERLETLSSENKTLTEQNEILLEQTKKKKGWFFNR